MSLHANLRPEARAALHRQQRINRASSVGISILILLFVGIVLAIITLIPVPNKDIDVFVMYPETKADPPIEAPQFDFSMERKPTPPSQRMMPNIVVNMPAAVAIPRPDQISDVPSLDLGTGDEFGFGGDGNEFGGPGFPNLPRSTSSRCSLTDRMKRLEETGGTPECEKAVVSALDWLQSQQADDGSWKQGSKPVAMTGLALLAYLGHCETPVSEKYGDTVLRAITYLVNNGIAQEGRLSSHVSDKHWPYEHAIATYALAEAHVFCRELDYDIPELATITTKAGQYIIDHQHSRSGGWDYGYDQSGNRGGDLSVTAWQIQALKACSNTQLHFDGMKRAKRRAADYVENLVNDAGGFGYTSRTSHNSDYATLTGAGALSLQITGNQHPGTVRKAVKYIRERSKFDYPSVFSDLYGHYYEAQVMMNEGGKSWDWYNGLFRDQLLRNQLPDGSWPAPGSQAGGKIRAVAPQYTSNAVYRVCLNTLMLEVYYRYLPSSEN